ncbi:MAG: ethylbenzene dehydrogenase-related protein [Planctomycetota bacterium]|nr:ethylbenzene dehydrogenase-related protein [Planctomycetota bacterium]
MKRTQHAWTWSATLVALSLVGCRTAHDARSGGRTTSLLWEAAHTTTAPAIDGRVDAVWNNAQPLTVVVREALGGGNPQEVVLRALYKSDRVYVLARWPDDTKSAMRDPYVWDAAKKTYERPTEPDDQFALEFPISGDFKINMMTTSEYIADVWHWKAGRGNPAGWVDDKRHLIGESHSENAHVYELGKRETVYIARPMDGGTRSYRVKERPTAYAGDRVDSYEPKEPSGSLADVRGKAVHDGANWTLEMSRRFDTGHADDAVIDRDGDNVCAIAILDDELYWRHSVSGRIRLRFARR